MDPETFKIRNMRMMPHVTRGTDVISNEDKMLMARNSGQSYQQMFVDPTFEMVLQRYEDISPPDTNYQKELIYSCDEPINLQKNPSPAVTGRSPQITTENIISNKNITTMQQNTEKYSYSETSQYFQTNHEKNDREYLPIDNIGVHQKNISEMQPLFNLQTSPDPAFESRWRDAEMPQHYLYPQLDLPRVAQIPEVAEKSQYVPAEHINRIQDDVRELPQNAAQSTHQRFNQSIQMSQQRYEEMTQNIYPQVPPYFDRNVYNPRPVQPSRLEIRHHQMPETRGSQLPNQYQQHRPKTVPRPNNVSGQSVSHKQQQNYHHSHNNTSYNTRRPIRAKQQRLLLQQQAYLQYYGQQNTNVNTTQQQNWSQEQQRTQQNWSQEQQRTQQNWSQEQQRTQQNWSQEQQRTQQNWSQEQQRTQQNWSQEQQLTQQNWSQEQQRILQQIYKHQRLCDYYQNMLKNGTALRNKQINR